MKTIVTNYDLSPVTTFRTDWYDTSAGLQLKSCACNGLKVCLYHWYTEVKEKEISKSAYKRGNVERPQGSEKKVGVNNSKPVSTEPVVRSTSSGKRTRSATPFQGKKPTKRA